MNRKLIAIILCACLCFALLAGCGSKIESYDGDGDTSETSAAPAGNGTGLETFDADTIVCTINGSAMTWEEYYYWLNYYLSYLESNLGTITDWAAANTYYTSYTNNDVVLGYAQSDMLYYHMLLAKADELGVAVSDETLAAQVVADADAAVGDGDGVLTDEEQLAFDELLAERNLSRDIYSTITREYMTQEALYEYNSAGYSDDDILDWANEQGYMAAKHILFLTVDMDDYDSTTGAYAALSDEEIAQIKAMAEDVYAQLEAVSDDQEAVSDDQEAVSDDQEAASDDQEALIALYDELMNEYSEDTGLANFPDGYCFLEGDMLTAFSDAVKELDVDYGLSGLVETELGYHIILRLPLDPDLILGYDSSTGTAYTVRNYFLSQEFNTTAQSWTEDVDISWEDGFDTLDLSLVF